MTEWDPYYRARGLRQRLPEVFRRHGSREEDRQRKAKADREDDASIDQELIDTAMSVVAQQERANLEQRLQALETANAQALIHNAEALDAAWAHIAHLLDLAFVIPDGRRVFRTEDGTQVFDEHGQEVSPDEVDPSAIGDDRPTWEQYRNAQQAEETLEREREDLLERQQRLDDARQDILEGDLDPGDIEALDAEFTSIKDPAHIAASVDHAFPNRLESEDAKTAIHPRPATKI